MPPSDPPINTSEGPRAFSCQLRDTRALDPPVDGVELAALYRECFPEGTWTADSALNALHRCQYIAVRRDAGKLIAVLGLELMPIPSDPLYLVASPKWLAVAKSHRGHGLSKELGYEVVRVAHALGAKQFTGVTRDFTPPVEKFWRAMGVPKSAEYVF